MNQPLLVLSDTHLSRDYGEQIGVALSTLVTTHPDCELVLAGDILDLSLDGKQVPPNVSLRAGLAPHSQFVQALQKHLKGGGKVTLIPGNHDAGLTNEGNADLFRSLLEAPNEQCVEVSPWFVRRGDVHIEHGHLYDPDCANNHPLANHDPAHEGLGTALMRRFVSPQDAFILAHANQTTPTSGLYRVFKIWGVRAPLLILSYFRTAIALCAEAGLHGKTVERAKQQGAARMRLFAESSGLDPDILHQLIELAPEPTHHRFQSTFLRLYFDRVFAGCSLAIGLSMMAAAGLKYGAATSLFAASGGLTASGAILSALGSGYLAQNLVTNKNRYGNVVISQLRDAAKSVAQVTQSSLVIFGHTHVEADEPGYVNLGSFGFTSPHRPYLLVDTAGHHERRRT